LFARLESAPWPRCCVGHERRFPSGNSSPFTRQSATTAVPSVRAAYSRIPKVSSRSILILEERRRKRAQMQIVPDSFALDIARHEQPPCQLDDVDRRRSWHLDLDTFGIPAGHHQYALSSTSCPTSMNTSSSISGAPTDIAP
jgi:hypothetical protein